MRGPLVGRGLSPQGCGIVGLRSPRWLGGDISLINEVCRARGFQEELAVRAPEHPARVFGEAVEAGGVTEAGPCESLIGRMLPSLLEKITETLTETLSEKLTAHIDERFEAFEKLHRARGGPYALADADPRPLSIAQFLKERAEPVPKNFAPAFGTLVAVSGLPLDPPCTRGLSGVVMSCCPPQVFRQQAAKQQGLASESRGRYTERDRPIMEHCWMISQAYRQGLVSRANSSESAAEPRPSVLELLKCAAPMQ